MALIIIIVSFAPMLLVGVAILFQFRHSYHEKVYAHISELVLKHKQNIDRFLEERLANILMMARTYTYEELSDETFLEDRLALLQASYGPVFVDLGVINARGIQVAYSGPFRLGRALYSEAQWFQEAMKREYYISDVFLGLRGLPHFIVAVRENWNGEPWILRATIDFVSFNDLVENIRIGKTGLAFILNRKGEFQTKAQVDLGESINSFKESLKDKDKANGEVQILGGPDDKRRKIIYVGAFLKNGDWILVYRQKASDAFSDLNRAFKMALIIFLICGMGIVAVAFLLSRRMVNRIAKSDQEKEMINRQMIETAKLASVGELAAGIAHEINNPVAIMVEEAGWVEDLLEEEEFKDGENLQEFRRALEQIRVQGRRCKEITHKLLSFARKTDTRPQHVQVNQIIEEVVSLSAQRAKFSNVEIEVELEKELPTIEASPSELQQVFLNLINNALDAMDKRGGTIKISSYSAGDQAVFEFSDNGPGIPQGNLERIFDPFFTTKPVGKGTGLGLSICYGIIKKMGGDIEVDSIVEQGTTFRIKIPRSSDFGKSS